MSTDPHSSLAPATRSEIAATAISDVFRGNGEILASPIGLVPSLGARLAKLTHSPELLLSDGEATIFADVPALGEPFTEPEGYLPYRLLFELMQNGKRHVVMGAAQIDQYGNQNLSAIGDRNRPTKQLLGARAASMNTASHAVSYWLARHLPRVFVDRVDIVTGVGRPQTSGAKTHHDLRQVVTNLGVFDFSGPDGAMHVVSLHPGVTREEVQSATGFVLHFGTHLGEATPTTRQPTTEELALIRERLDPQNLREREVPSL